MLVSDNRLQYTSQEFTEFSRKWVFKHVTSPRHPKSNSESESAVKVAKWIFKKALKEDGWDPWLSLKLDQQNTLTESVHASPVHRLMSMRTRTLLPVASNLLHPKVPDHVHEKLRTRREKAKAYHDSKAVNNFFGLSDICLIKNRYYQTNHKIGQT